MIYKKEKKQVRVLENKAEFSDPTDQNKQLGKPQKAKNLVQFCYNSKHTYFFWQSCNNLQRIEDPEIKPTTFYREMKMGEVKDNKDIIFQGFASSSEGALLFIERERERDDTEVIIIEIGRAHV